MNIVPEASFDLLVLLARMERAYPDLHAAEIHALLYLAQLLSVYDNHSPEAWQYYFTSHKLAGPYATATAEALESHLQSGEVSRVVSQQMRYSITERGHTRLGFLLGLERFRWRHKYLLGAADAAMSRPIPEFIRAVRLEPMTSQAERTEQRQTLASPSPNWDDLNDQFRVLRSTLGSETEDVWLAGLLWLDYLVATEHEGKAEGEAWSTSK